MASESANRGRMVELGDLLETPGGAGAAMGEAVFLVAADGHTVLWASERAAQRLGHRDAAALVAAALPADSPGARRLGERARALPASGAGQLERLRFFAGFRSLLLTALCSPARLKDGRGAMVVSLIGDMPGETAENRPVGALSGSALDGIHEATTDAMLRLDLVAKRLPHADAPTMAAPMEGVAPARPTQDAGPAEPPEPAAPARQAPAWTELEPAARRPVRFTFTTDADGRITRLSEHFADALGAAALDPGARLGETVGEFDSPAGIRLAEALAAGQTFNGIGVNWPVADGEWQVPVEFSALPLGGRHGAGFAGFGRIRLDEARRREIPADLPASLPIDPPPALDDGASDADEWPADAVEEAASPEVETQAAATQDVAAEDVAAEALSSLAAAGAMAQQAEADEPMAPEVNASDMAEAQSSPEMQQQTAAAETVQVAATDAAQNFVEAEPALPEETAIELAVPGASVARNETAGQEHPDAAALHVADQPAGDDDEPGRLPGSEPAQEIKAAEFDVAPDHAPSGEEGPPQPPTAVEPLASTPAPNVVSIRTGQPTSTIPGFQRHGLSSSERNAFREIARALGARFEDDESDDTTTEPAAPSDAPAPAAAAFRDPADRTIAEDAAAIRRFGRRVADQPPAERAEAPGSLIDRIPIGILVLKEDKPLYANATLLDLTGYPDFLHFAAEDGPRAIFRKAVLPREASGIDTVALSTREGELVPVEAHLQLVDWDGGKATLISVRRAVEFEQGRALRTVALDLKRARGEAGELRAILDTATDGVLTLDEKGAILSLNGAAEALFGLAQNEVVGESFTRLLVNESHADALDYLDGLKAAGVKSVLNDGRDVLGRERNGGKIPLFMTLGRINDDEPRRYCAVLRDMTAWKRAEAQLTEARRAAEQASAKKSDFLAKISHEIRTPMNAIIGFAELMQEERLGPVGNAKYREYLGDIRTSGQHVVSLVNDLLDLAKIEAGRMEMNFAATDINSVVAGSVGIIQPQANAARVLVRTQLAGKLPPVVADERSIRQIVLNMLANATRYTEAGGQVIVATALTDGGEAVIRIRDTGIGMSPTEIEQALEPFRQVGSTLRRQGGTGLGLPLTKALVEANRASFAIRSTPGEGTLVEITFPATRVLAE